MTLPDVGVRNVSVVIPTHDRPVALAKAIRSALAQSPYVREILVADDAGSPGTAQVIREAQGSAVPITLLDRSSGRPGPSASRNAGARRATGEWVGFLDDDDEMAPGYLEAAAAALRRTRGAQIIVTWAVRRTPAGELVASNQLPTDFKGEAPRRYWEYGTSGSNVVVRRDLVESVDGFDEDMWALEDLDFFVRLLAHGASHALVAEPLIIQSSDAGGHLSAKSPRAEAGARRYLDKHRAEMSRRERRAVRRYVHAMANRPGVPLLHRLGHFAAVVALSDGQAWSQSVRNRLRGHHLVWEDPSARSATD